MREGGSDLGPLLTGLAVGFVFLDGEDVEVCECGSFRGGLDSGGLIIGILAEGVIDTL
jgi:hypothetical protein